MPGARETYPAPPADDLDRRAIIDTAAPEPSNPDDQSDDPAARRAAALRLLRRAHLHDLRGELNALHLQVTLLQRGGRSADPARLARWIESVASQAGALERGLDNLSMIENLDDRLSNATVAEIASRVVELLGPLARTRRVELRFQDDEDGSDGGTKTAPGLARRLLKLGARCLAVTPAGAVCTLSCSRTSDPQEMVDGILLEVSTDAAQAGTSTADAFIAETQIDALRQGIHSDGWAVEREARGVVLRIPR